MPIVNTNIAETINITENGQHDVARYTTANVGVACVPRTVDANGVLNAPVITGDFLGGATDIGNNMLYQAFYSTSSTHNPSASGVNINMSSLTRISGSYACYGTFRNCTGITGKVDLSNLTAISGGNACQYMFNGCTGITSVDLSSLTTISGSTSCQRMFLGCSGITGALDLSSLTSISGSNACQYMFQDCTGITSVDLSSLKTSGGTGFMFSNCTGITSINLSSLEKVTLPGSQMFSGCSGITGAVNLSSLVSAQSLGAWFQFCTGITSVDLSSLYDITSGSALANMFRGCTALTSFNLSSLSVISYTSACSNMFADCTNLTSLSFPALNVTSFGSYTNQFSNMLSGVTGCTVHFPSNLQSVIGSWSDVTAGFGGTNTTVLFDLPSTQFIRAYDFEYIAKTYYKRNPKYDTPTSLAWRVWGSDDTTIDWTPFYTMGTSAPQLDDSIYSDAACTTAIGFIDYIDPLPNA